MHVRMLKIWEEIKVLTEVEFEISYKRIK